MAAYAVAVLAQDRHLLRRGRAPVIQKSEIVIQFAAIRRSGERYADVLVRETESIPC
jgi:hypothetical protein